MRFENVAKPEKGSIEKSISIEQLDNGNYRVTSTNTKPKGVKESVSMEFTQNGLNALVGTWMVFTEGASK